MSHNLSGSKSLPLYQQFKGSLLEKIYFGIYKAGERIPGEHELCAEYGISRSTVRQALADLQEEGLLIRNRGKGSYVSPDFIRDSIKDDAVYNMTDHTGSAVALIAPRPHIYLMPKIIAGMQSELMDRGIELVVYDSADDPGASEAMIDKALDDGAIGLIVQPPEETPYSVRCHSLQRSGFPMVMCDRPYRRVSTDCVMTDNLDGGFTGVSHLLGLGHTDIAFISFTGISTFTVNQRYDGYRTALENAGINPDPTLTLAPEKRSFGDEQTFKAAWAEALTVLLSKDKRPTAVFAVNDRVAMEVIRIAEGMGISVPGELAIVGFDNSDLASIYRVPLTTIEQPLGLIGKESARLLVERLGGTVNGTRWIQLKAGLIVRKSCGQHLSEIQRAI